MKDLIENYIDEMTERAEDCKVAGYVNEMKILRTIVLTLNTMLKELEE